MPGFTIDGHTIGDDEVPGRGPFVDIPKQEWARSHILGDAQPSSVLTYLHSPSQEWSCEARTTTATKDKLLELYNSRRAVILVTPQDTDGYPVLVSEFDVPHAEPEADSRWLCQYTLTRRPTIAEGATPDEQEDDLPTLVRKTVDETVNNSSALQDDDELYLAVGANEIWVFEIIVLFTSGGTPDFKWRLAAPAGHEGAFTVIYNISTADWSIYGYGQITLSAEGNAMDPIGASGSVNIRGLVKNGATAGNIQFKWAQETADPSDTVVQKNSHIIAHKIE